MMKRVTSGVRWFFSNPRCVFVLGLLVAILATFLEVVRRRNMNWHDYHDGTMMIWSGMSPYTDEYVQGRHIWFLYLPFFSYLFGPFFFIYHNIGPFVWNVFNYVMLFISVWTLPGYLQKYKLSIFLYILILAEFALFSCQFNVVVCYIFLFSFTLLEKNHNLWAILLIMISAFTKIYGIIQLAILFCYPKLLKNYAWAILLAILFALCPVLTFGFDGMISLYHDWIYNIGTHETITGDYPGILFAYGLKSFLLPNYRIVQVGVLLILAIIFFSMKKRWSDFRFRVQGLGVLMAYIILFSDSPEYHTYVVFLSGYMMCYYTWKRKTVFDKILFWACLVFCCLVPCDVFCPVWLNHIINETYYINVYIYTAIWLTMIYRTITYDYEADNNNITLSPAV